MTAREALEQALSLMRSDSIVSATVRMAANVVQSEGVKFFGPVATLTSRERDLMRTAAAVALVINGRQLVDDARDFERRMQPLKVDAELARGLAGESVWRAPIRHEPGDRPAGG